MESLDDLRKEIDRIDNQMVSLLLERATYVKQVGERKAARNEQKSFIRSGREASMVRKLSDQLKSLYHPAATLAIWRTIISSSLSMEQPMNIASHVTPENDTSFWLAREYFGAFSSIRTVPSAVKLVREVKSGLASVGVLPYPSDRDRESWWEEYLFDSALPRVFAVIPFVEDNRDVSSLALANLEPEATGDDYSLLAIAINDTVSKDRLASVFEANGLPLRFHAAKLADKTGKRRFFVSTHSFLTSEHQALQSVVNTLGKEAIQIALVGAFATPIHV